MALSEPQAALAALMLAMVLVACLSVLAEIHGGKQDDV